MSEESRHENYGAIVSMGVLSQKTTEQSQPTQSRRKIVTSMLVLLIFGLIVSVPYRFSGHTATKDTNNRVIEDVQMQGIPILKDHFPRNDIPHLNAPDAVVVGSGLAGSTAALHILDRGGTVVMIEKESLLGGNSNKASSGINACCSPEDYEDGDSLFDFQEDTVRSAGDLAHPDLISVLTGNSEKAIVWIHERVGVDLSKKAQLGGHSHPRTHRPEKGLVGAVTMSGLHEAIRVYEERGKVVVMMNTKVTSLITDVDGAVVGVEYEYVNQSAIHVRQKLQAANVVLATGGFASDRSLGSVLSQYRPELLKFPTSGGKYSTGDGISIATSIGADTVDMDRVQLHPTGFIDPSDPNNPTKTLAAELLRGVGGILINDEGKRFCNELGTRAYVSDKMLSHNPDYLITKKWDPEATVPSFNLVLSSSAADIGKRHVELYSGKGLLTRLDGIEKLAEYTGAPKHTLVATMKLYLDAAIIGIDEFGKTTFNGLPQEDLTNEIFYVGKVQPLLHYCMGGLAINTEGNVLDMNGDLIAGLYAAGEVTGGVHGNNRLGGNSLLDCVVYGTVVGEKITVTPGSILLNPKEIIEAREVDLKTVTAKELSQHNYPDDCWVAVHGVVYDLTTFAEIHPGGARAIYNLAGTDATNTFSFVHSKNMLAGFTEKRVGILEGAELPSDDYSSYSVPTAMRNITYEELQQHKTATDLWVAVNGFVYDLTEFNHPGGANRIIRRAGTDATASFFRHHDDAYLLRLESMKLGHLLVRD